MPRPRRPKGRGASFESQGRPTSSAIAKYKRSITNSPVRAIGQQSRPIVRRGRHVMRCLTPAAPPSHKCSAQIRASRRGQAVAVSTREQRRAGAPAARVACGENAQPSLKRIPRQEMRPDTTWVRSAALSMVAAAARRQGTPFFRSPRDASGAGDAPAGVLIGSPASDPAQVGRCGRERRGANPREVDLISPYSLECLCLSAVTARTEVPTTTGGFPPARCASGRRPASRAEATDLFGARSASTARSGAGCAGPASCPAASAAGTFPFPTSRSR